MDDLTRLAIRHDTDKFGLHDYTPVYDALFCPWRDRPVRVLEIGVGGYGHADRGGGSLAMWRDYFPQGRIVGLDVAPKQLDLGPRVSIRQGAQADPTVIAALIVEEGPFDIIIDDGSHRPDDVLASWRLLGQALVPGGIYVVEDVQTAFMMAFGGSADLSAPNHLAALRDLALDLGAGHPVEPALQRIERHHNLIVMVAADGSVPDLMQAPDALRAAAAGQGALWQGGGGTGAPIVALSVDRLSSDAALTRALEGRADGEALVFAWPDDTELLRRLFVDIDHHEIAAIMPGSPVLAAAARVLSLVIVPGGVMVVQGPNDFPSIRAYHLGSRRAVLAQHWVQTVLLDPETQPSQAQLLGLLDRALLYARPGSSGPIQRRLAEIGADDAGGLQLQILAAGRGGDWGPVATVALACAARSTDAVISDGYRLVAAWAWARAGSWSDLATYLGTDATPEELTLILTARAHATPTPEDGPEAEALTGMVRAARRDLREARKPQPA
ncbi:MAG: hypothetical protein ACK4IA_00585 [Paracoccus hibiscisoli]|uniref:hypothetical protein n=1 Tax=Paracoccus hibiscisoli TaxID=2023261 RepID=UPI00391D6A90